MLLKSCKRFWKRHLNIENGCIKNQIVNGFQGIKF